MSLISVICWWAWIFTIETTTTAQRCTWLLLRETLPVSNISFLSGENPQVGFSAFLRAKVNSSDLVLLDWLNVNNFILSWLCIIHLNYLFFDTNSPFPFQSHRIVSAELLLMMRNSLNTKSPFKCCRKRSMRGEFQRETKANLITCKAVGNSKQINFNKFLQSNLNWTWISSKFEVQLDLQFAIQFRQPRLLEL